MEISEKLKKHLVKFGMVMLGLMMGLCIAHSPRMEASYANVEGTSVRYTTVTVDGHKVIVFSNASGSCIDAVKLN